MQKAVQRAAFFVICGSCKRLKSEQISDQDIFYQSAVDISKTVLAPLELVHKPLVIDTHLVKDRGVQIVNMNRVTDDVIRVVICLSKREAWLHPSTGKHIAKASRVMVASSVFFR